MPIPPRRTGPVALRRAVPASLAVACLLAACGSDGPESQTPQIEVDGEAATTELLLTPEDTSPISGFDGVEARDLDDVPVFENPDPRGPCGSPVEAPSFEGAAGRALTGSTIGLIQLVMPASPAVRGYLDGLIADQGPPCDGYTSTTNTGAEQTVSEITQYQLAGEGVDGVAWTNLVEVGGEFLYAGVVALETADTITFVQVQSATAIPAEGIELIAERTILRLRGQG